MRDGFRDFLMGYLTAYNAIATDTYNALGGLTLENALAWLDDYCSAHHLDSFDRAITQLVLAHHDTRLRTPSGHAPGWGRAPADAGAE